MSLNVVPGSKTNGGSAQRIGAMTTSARAGLALAQDQHPHTAGEA
jgi:hypothetical protein